MGQELRCSVRFGRKVSEGRAYLETDELLFRGEFRLAIPLKEIASVEAANGRLTVRFAGGTAAFDLGPQAAKWAERIRSPKSLLDRLGIRPGARVTVLGVKDDNFMRDLRARTPDVSTRLRKASDAIFLGAETRAALRRLPALANAIARDGAIWVVNPKGVREITEADVLAAGRAAELVDVKVARFSATHTAHKMVILVARR